MAFFVYGRDVPDVDQVAGDSDDLDDAHWSYMDGFASELIARGPTLSPDGSMHTGSVHIVDLPDAATARRFAFEEPYYRAGVYEEVTVLPYAPLVEGTMWDRPSPRADQQATFVLATWIEPAFWRDIVVELRDAGTGSDRWVFAGALLSEDSTAVRGVAAAVHLESAEADDLVRTAIGHAPGSPIGVERHRWRRGGRPAE